MIDAAARRMLGLTQMSRLSVMLEGGRLVITPLVGNGDPRPPSRREAQRVVDELRKLGFKQAHFDQLVPAPMRLGTYVMKLDRVGEVSPEVAVIMCRLAELRRLLREGWKASHAIASAVAAYPFELPSGIETRFDDEEEREDVDVDVARAEVELAMRESQCEAQEREDQRLAQEARDRYA
ncbi:MAG: hypothetical protein JO257_08695 [Deltaproteobacteria bacterium]|nr:hypothetical protein [Deltaproteobacteria bacterium]